MSLSLKIVRGCIHTFVHYRWKTRKCYECPLPPQKEKKPTHFFGETKTKRCETKSECSFDRYSVSCLLARQFCARLCIYKKFSEHTANSTSDTELYWWKVRSCQTVQKDWAGLHCVENAKVHGLNFSRKVYVCGWQDWWSDLPGLHTR